MKTKVFQNQKYREPAEWQRKYYGLSNVQTKRCYKCKLHCYLSTLRDISYKKRGLLFRSCEAHFIFFIFSDSTLLLATVYSKLCVLISLGHAQKHFRKTPQSFHQNKTRNSLLCNYLWHLIQKLDSIHIKNTLRQRCSVYVS